MVRRGLVSFGHFWWDFIVGDTPEVAVGVAVIVIAGSLLNRATQLAAVLLVPLAVIALLFASVWRGRRST